jgi:hypothetical protein
VREYGKISSMRSVTTAICCLQRAFQRMAGSYKGFIVTR